MGLKYCISSKQFDPKVLEHPKRGPEVVEKTMEQVLEMTKEQVLQQDISRLTLLRLAAQMYDKLAYILGPLMLAWSYPAKHVT